MTDDLAEQDTMFHVGDKVTVREDLVIGESYKSLGSTCSDSYVTGMDTCKGKICTIKRVTEDGKYKLCEDYGFEFNWTDEMFKEAVCLPDLPEPEDISVLCGFVM